MNNQLYTMKQAAELLNISYHTVWRMVADNDIQVVKFRSCKRITQDEINRLLNTCHTNAKIAPTTGSATRTKAARELGKVLDIQLAKTRLRSKQKNA